MPCTIAIMSERIRRRAFRWPLIRGTCETTHVGAAVARAPDADPFLVHLRKRAGVGNGVTVVGDLPPGVDVLTGLAIAGAEAAIVEDKSPEAGGGVNLGVFVEVVLLHGGKT